MDSSFCLRRCRIWSSRYVVQGGQHKVKARPPDRLAVIDVLKRRDEGLLHAKDRVGTEIGIVTDEGVGHDLLEARRGDEVMHMGRSKGVAPEATEHLTHGSVVRNRVGNRL